MPSLQDSLGHVFDFRAVDCPTCATTPTRVLGMRGGKFHRYGRGVPTVIMQCETCTLIFPNPFPVPRHPGEIYGDLEQYFGGADQEEKITRYRSLIADLRKRSGKSNPSLLDVGSGRGEMVVAAQREGLGRVVGLETTPAMVEHVQRTYDIALSAMSIEEFSASGEERFDTITLSAILEHVHDPNAMMAAVAKLSSPGAVVYIDVPNEPNLLTRTGNALNRLLGSPAVYNLSPTFAPFHVFGFNPRALRALLEKHGFLLEEVVVRDDGACHIATTGVIAPRRS